MRLLPVRIISLFPLLASSLSLKIMRAFLISAANRLQSIRQHENLIFHTVNLQPPIPPLSYLQTNKKLRNLPQYSTPNQYPQTTLKKHLLLNQKNGQSRRHHLRHNPLHPLLQGRPTPPRPQPPQTRGRRGKRLLGETRAEGKNVQRSVAAFVGC